MDELAAKARRPALEEDDVTVARLMAAAQCSRYVARDILDVEVRAGRLKKVRCISNGIPVIAYRHV